MKKQEYTGTTLDKTYDYLGSVQYLNGTSQFASTGEGRVYNNSGTFRYDYFMKDQVGNIRLTYTANGSSVTILQRDEYYPFGNTFGSYLGSGGANTYKFNGMEYQENGLNTIDFHARMYDPQIGRTFQPDPHADSYAAKSPFSFLANNPIRYTDPTGMDEMDDFGSSGGSDPGSLFPGSATANTGSWFTGSGKSFRGAGGFYAAFNARGQWRAEKGRSNWIDRMPRYKFEVVDRYKDWYEGSEYNGYHYKNTTYQGQYFLLSYVQGDGEGEGAQNWRPDADGKLTFEEAIWWYRLGKGQPVYVNLNSLNLSSVRASSFKGGVNSSQSFNLFKLPPSEQGLVYGNITLYLMNNNKVFAYPDYYDFDLKMQNGTFKRDAFTIMGQYYNGAGTPYNIYFYNSVPIKP